jgi:tRNA(Ile)-lysidine synthase
LQEANMPPWLRDRLPLIYFDDALAVVPNIGVSCLMQATEKELGLVITWVTAE